MFLMMLGDYDDDDDDDDDGDDDDDDDVRDMRTGRFTQTFSPWD